MYFSNLLDRKVNVSRGKSFPFVCEYDDRVLENAHIVLENNQLTVKVGDEYAEKDLFLKGLSGVAETAVEGIATKSKRIHDFTYGELKDTAENPLIVVLASGFSIYAGCRSLVKYIELGDGYVLAMLVFGACSFSMEDGTEVPMHRCDFSDISERAMFKFTGETIKNMSNVVDKESNYRVNGDMVNAVLVNFSSSKGKVFDGVSYRTVKEMSTLFKSDVMMQEREKVAERKARAEAKRVAIEAERAQRSAEARAERERQQEEALKEQQKEFKVPKERKPRTPAQAQPKKEESGRNAQASAFLAMVNGLQ